MTTQKTLKKFHPGETLKSRDLNDIYKQLAKAAQKKGKKLKSKIVWEPGSILTAASLNILLELVEQLYQSLNLKKPTWSFEKFKDGMVLKAKHLNEIVEKINRCLV